MIKVKQRARIKKLTHEKTSESMLFVFCKLNNKGRTSELKNVKRNRTDIVIMYP